MAQKKVVGVGESLRKNRLKALDPFFKSFGKLGGRHRFGEIVVHTCRNTFLPVSGFRKRPGKGA